MALAFYRLPAENWIGFIRGKEMPAGKGFQYGKGFLAAPFKPGKESLYITAQEEKGLSLKHLDTFKCDFFFNSPGKGEGQFKKTYLQNVGKALLEIEAGNFEKLVMARNKFIPLPSDFKLIEFYKRLCQEYPDAFVSLLSSPTLGTWIGATPELLLETGEGRIRTVALAGTGSVISGNLGEKEYIEQKLVEDFILGRFALAGIRGERGKPLQMEAGNLRHFRSEITAESNTSWELLVDMLHPTPAVSGLPQKEAVEWILEKEGFDRGNFSGYLGTVDGNKVRLYVNLRCMQVFRDSALLYAGAGIVKGSEPEKEWQETEEKMNTLLNVINKMYG